MKKIPKMSKILLCAAVLCGVFLFPAMTAYAEEAPDIIELVEETEVLETAEIPIISNFEPPVPVVPVIPVIEDKDNSRPNGNGSLIEDVRSGEVSRQFITVQSKGGNIFYIIIENDGKKENVYFLNAVDDFDLLSFSDNFPDGVLESYEQLKSEAARAEAEKIISEGNTGENGNSETPKKSDKPEKSGEKTENEKADGGNNSMLIIGVLAVVGIGGAVYFKVIKPKQSGKKNKKPVYDDEEEEDDEPVNEDVSENSDNDEEDE